MIKKIFLFVLIFLFAIYASIFFPKIKNFFAAKFSCGKVGEIVGAAGLPENCCDGLKKIAEPEIKNYDKNCNFVGAPGGLQICANCGNEICEPKNWENKCNCAVDCGEN